jgi:hypothetical protein
MNGSASRAVDKGAGSVLGAGRFPLSNRGETGHFLATPSARGGLDTVGISVPVADYDPTGCTVSIRKAGTAEETRTFRRKLDRGGFAAWGIGDVVWLEASLPKRKGDDNIEAVSTSEAWELLADMHEEASSFIEYDQARDGQRFETSKVVRLDLVRDFDGVQSPGFILDGLAQVPVTGRSKRRRFADGERNRAQTLTVGPMKAWAATLYDKHEETLGKAHVAPEGRVRFETRLRSDVLTSVWARDNGGQVRQVMDLEDVKLEQLRRGMFERVGFDREVQAMGRLAEVVLAAEDLTAAERRGLWAYLTLAPYGGDLGYSRMTERKYRRLAEDLGVVMIDPRTEGPNVTVQLDYDQGREVTRVAA